MTDPTQSHAASTCPKCGHEDIATLYHPTSVRCDKHSRFTHSYRDGEHLHLTCRRCAYDWCEDVLNAA